MKDTFDISSAFNMINENERNKFLDYIENLYNENFINTEILLNLVKAFIYIFELNPEYVSIYNTIFNKLSIDEKTRIFNLIKKINLSKQTLLDEFIIEKIISSINSYIINNYKKLKYYELLSNIYNIYEIIYKYNKINLKNKIQLYIILLKSNVNINDTRQIIVYLNQFI
jgi:hypothetical protein